MLKDMPSSENVPPLSTTNTSLWDKWLKAFLDEQRTQSEYLESIQNKLNFFVILAVILIILSICAVIKGFLGI